MDLLALLLKHFLFPLCLSEIGYAPADEIKRKQLRSLTLK